MDDLEWLDGHGTACFLVEGKVGGFGVGELLKAFHNSCAGVVSMIPRCEPKFLPVFFMIGTLEEEVELEVDEAKSVELLVVGSVKLVDYKPELGEGAPNEVHETVNGSVAGFRLGDSSGKHGRIHSPR